MFFDGVNVFVTSHAIEIIGDEGTKGAVVGHLVMPTDLSLGPPYLQEDAEKAMTKCDYYRIYYGLDTMRPECLFLRHRRQAWTNNLRCILE